MSVVFPLMRADCRIFPIGVLALLTSCASVEVKKELTENVQQQGKTYAQEMRAQSPFKKVTLTWAQANELMKVRNLKYRNAVLEGDSASRKKSMVKSFSSEVTNSLTKTVKNSFDPKKLAKAFQNPIAAIPNQIKSLSDIKNISHSMTQSEWGRVVDTVGALERTRHEQVKLHVLFCQQEILEQQLKSVDKIEKQIKTDVTASKDKRLVSLLKKSRSEYEREKERWLNGVRDFFDAEYYDVELRNYKGRLSHYHGVNNPNFTDWKRWRQLDHSRSLARKLKDKHKSAKPILPGVNSLKNKFSTSHQKKSFVGVGEFDPGMRKEVRELIRGWRELKSVQSQLAKTKLASADDKSDFIASLKKSKKIYQLKQQELKQLSRFWLTDERCWL